MPYKATIASGVAANSLGALWVKAYAEQFSDARVLAFDREHEPALTELPHVVRIEFDLNPLVGPNSYRDFVERLNFQLDLT
jgi:hypothetical protein